LSLRLSTIPDLDLVELEAGADAVQLKIDTWSPDLQKLIGKHVATIRRNLRVPVIFQVRILISISLKVMAGLYMDHSDCQDLFFYRSCRQSYSNPKSMLRRLLV
jgi:hypothetical protein